MYICIIKGARYNISILIMYYNIRNILSTTKRAKKSFLSRTHFRRLSINTFFPYITVEFRGHERLYLMSSIFIFSHFGRWVY